MCDAYNLMFPMQMISNDKSIVIILILLISLNVVFGGKGETPSKYPQTSLNLNSIDGSTSFNYVQYNPDGDLLAIEHQVDGVHQLRIADSTTFEVIGEIKGEFSSPISWSPNGKYIAIRYNLSKVAIIDTATFEIVNILFPKLPEMHTSDESVRDIEWTHSGDLLAIGRGFGSGSLQIWNTSSGYKALIKILDTDANASYLSFKSDNTILALGGNIENITFWDLNTLSQIRSFMVGEYNGFIDWAPNSDLLVLGGDDNFHIYDFAKDEFVKRNIIKAATSAINFALWSNNGEYIAYSYREDPYSPGTNVLKVLDYNEDNVIYSEDWGEDGRSISWHPSSERFVMTDRRSVIVVAFKRDSTTLGDGGTPLNFNITMLVLPIVLAYRIKRRNFEN